MLLYYNYLLVTEGGKFCHSTLQTERTLLPWWGGGAMTNNPIQWYRQTDTQTEKRTYWDVACTTYETHTQVSPPRLRGFFLFGWLLGSKVKASVALVPFWGQLGFLGLLIARQMSLLMSLELSRFYLCCWWLDCNGDSLGTYLYYKCAVNNWNLREVSVPATPEKLIYCLNWRCSF